MTWGIQYDATKGLVLVKAQGALQSTALRQMTEEVRHMVLTHKSKRVLIDYTQTLSKLEPYEIFERPKILQQLGFPSDVKLAVLYCALDENTQFLENVYRNKKFPLRVFAEPALAMAWLEGQGA